MSETVKDEKVVLLANGDDSTREQTNEPVSILQVKTDPKVPAPASEDSEAAKKDDENNIEVIDAGKNRFGRESLNRRVTRALIILMALMAVAIVIISVYSTVNIYYAQYTSKAQDLVRLLADEIDGDWLRDFSKSYDQDEQYKLVKQYLDVIKSDFNELQYLYIYKPEEDHFTYLIEAQSDMDDPNLIANAGDIYEYRDRDYERLVPDIKAGRASTGVILGEDTGYGRPISAWAPIFDSKGELVAMVEADYIIENIGKQISLSVALITAVQVISIFFVVLLIVGYIRKNVVEPVTVLTRSVDSYEHGEYKADMSAYKHNDEIRSLAISFGDMTGRINDYIEKITTITAEKERIGAELNVATQIQADMLPRIFPPFPQYTEFELYATMDPAKEVGGDFYDFFMIDEQRLGLVIADVSGKGIPAALFMVIAKTLIKDRAMTGGYAGPGEVLESVNNQLCEGNDADMFVTAWFGILDVKTGEIDFASAGHEYPAFHRLGEGFVVEKDKHGPPLATFEGIKMRDNHTQLQKGETLYLYTDGVTEATNGAFELFGEERMLESLSS
ncbi:MAG: PP2C family protein-serine/threonine phosphatase, partial [Lachnospiraceae bacterium]|nr:PP2C family protein-serine/threonine phosphatase [Lachnospiraceae bacterium]